MTLTLALLNLIIGAVYTSYGILTLRELAVQRHSRALSHFGVAWVAMAFTCGPHHLDHGLHLLVSRSGTALELPALLLGVGPGVGWFLLRLEALSGGRGDREIHGTPGWLRAFAVTAALGLFAATIWVVAVGTPVVTSEVLALPNVLLVALYVVIAVELLRGQFANHATADAWSVSGIALTLVFATCALMHAAYVAQTAGGVFGVDQHGLVIGWAGVPAAVYFLWVVRAIRAGTLGGLQLRSLPPRPVREGLR